jgi:hypothetical protein
LKDYEEYNLFVEARSAFYGATGTQMTALFVMGKNRTDKG